MSQNPIIVSSNKPKNIKITLDRVLRTKTISQGTPMGLLLVWTYPANITVIG